MIKSLYWWVCEDHLDQPWGHQGCEAAGELCTNAQCDKDADSIFDSVCDRDSTE